MIRAPLLWMALSYIAGVFSGDFFSYYPLTTLAVLLFIFLFENFFSSLRLAFSHYLLIFLFFWGGFFSAEWKQFYLPENAISRWTDQNILYTGVIDEAVAHYPDHTTLILESKKIEKYSKEFIVTGRLKLNINRSVALPLSYGDEIRVPITLREPHGFQNISGFDYGRYLRRHGIEATAGLTHPEELFVTGNRSGYLFLRKVYEWREEIRKKAVGSLSKEPLAIFLAIIIGESGYLTNQIRDDFMASGTTHILSISGSHLALVAFLVFNGMRWFLLHLPEPLLLRLGRVIVPSRLALLLSIPPVFLYGLLAGNQVATNRSMIMIGTFLIGQILNRDQSLLNPLGLSALAILIPDPYQAYDISFQLSFGSVLSIALALDRIQSIPAEKRLAATASSHPIKNIREHPLYLKSVQGLKNYLWISLATTVGTAPLVAYHFNQFNWVGVLANGIIIPVVGFVVVPVALLSSFASLLFSAHLLYAISLNEFLMTWFYKIVKFFALFPYAELHLASPSVLCLILFYASILILFYRPLTKKMGSILLIFILLLPLWWFWGPRLHFPSRELRVLFLDVGQGDSALIEFPDGQTMLIDGGGRYHEFDIGRLVVAPCLWNKGIHHLDYLVATHPQADHIGGLIYIVKKFSIGEVWTNGTEKESGISKEFGKSILERKLNSKVAQDGDLLKIGEVNLLVLNPHLKTPLISSTHAQENNDGIVVELNYNSRSVLFTADIETAAEKRILQDHPGMKVTLVKVPHHGGKGSADPEFIQTLSPDVSLFSAGLHNPYHHPNPDTLLLYQRIQSRIHRTDLDGALLFKTDGTAFEEMTANSLLPQKVVIGRKILRDEFENLSRVWHRFF